MAALVAATHAFCNAAVPKTWVPGTRPGMTCDKHSAVIPGPRSGARDP